MNCCAAILTGSNRATAGTRIAHGGPRLRTLARRSREAAGWIVPSSVLALLPKCPACIVAYLALGSGIGISVPTAIYLRMGLVILCVGSLAFCVEARAEVNGALRFLTLQTQKCLLTKILSSPPRPSIDLNLLKSLPKYFPKNVPKTPLNVI